MTDPEYDAQIRAALLEATMERWAPVLEGTEELVWSPKRQRVMDRLCRAPFRTARRRARPAWRNALSAAACVLLTCSVLFGGLIAFSPSARAWVQRVIEEWLPTDVTYRFTGDAQPETGDGWTLGCLPDGFQETGTEELLGRTSYENGDGLTLTFDYRSVRQGSGFNFDVEHSTYSEITLNGQPAHLFISNQELWPSCLIWFDETGNTGFQLMGYVTSEELIKMANSVSK